MFGSRPIRRSGHGSAIDAPHPQTAVACSANPDTLYYDLCKPGFNSSSRIYLKQQPLRSRYVDQDASYAIKLPRWRPARSFDVRQMYEMRTATTLQLLQD